MLEFIRTVAASALGFLAMRIATAWFDARVGHAGYLERERNADVDRLCNLANKVSDLATTYWLRDHGVDDTKDGPVLVADIGYMTRIVEELFTGEKFSNLQKGGVRAKYLERVRAAP